MKSSLYLIISAILIIAFSCNQSTSKSEQTHINTEIVESQTVIDLHEKLMTYFGADWMERESDPDLYPDFYAGSFIDNNGTFVVVVTGNRDQNKKLLIDILGTDNFNIETAQYSYKDMMKVMDDIDNFLLNKNIPDDHPVLTSFAGAYPDVMENRVKVLLTEVNDNIIRSFKRDITNSPLLIFEQGEIPKLY